MKNLDLWTRLKSDLKVKQEYINDKAVHYKLYPISIHICLIYLSIGWIKLIWVFKWLYITKLIHYPLQRFILL